MPPFLAGLPASLFVVHIGENVSHLHELLGPRGIHADFECQKWREFRAGTPDLPLVAAALRPIVANRPGRAVRASWPRYLPYGRRADRIRPPFPGENLVRPRWSACPR